MNTEKAYTMSDDIRETMKTFATLLCEIILCAEVPPGEPIQQP